MSAPTARSPLSSVAVIGLGRMGSAMATRLREQGRPVVGWSRSGRAVPGITTAPDASAAAAGADVVLLCLFDGPACRAVLDPLWQRLGPATVVVNTSTVGTADAAALAEQARAAGVGYVHAPVMGSVPAVLSGSLTLLVGADADRNPYHHNRAGVAEVLADLGNPVRCGTVRDAAAAKLLANGVLGNALLSLRDSRRRAEQMGLAADLAWTVLERTMLGRLAGGKRAQLEERYFRDAEFTVGALAKDLALLAEEAPVASPLRDAITGPLRAGLVAPDDDMAALVVADEPGHATGHGLSVAPDVTVAPEVLAPLQDYVAGHATGDAAYHRRAFLPSAHVEGVRDGRFVSWTLDEYCSLFTGRPAADEPARWRRIDRVEVTGSVATATMTLHHGPDVFTDVLLLVATDAGWRIANKLYDRATAANG